MKIQSLQRIRNGGGTTEYKNVNLTIGNGLVQLSGPNFGWIAVGILKDTFTVYNGAPYNLHLIVLVSGNKNTYRREEWFILF